MGNPFGVELPDNFGSSTAESSPVTESAPQGNESFQRNDNNTETTGKPVDGVLDLDKLDRFRFQGKEWTAKDLRSAYMMKQDYTRKTQEVSETRKYADNFDADLSSILENPQLLDEMRKVYPASYVAVAEKVLARAQAQGSSPSSNSQGTTTQTNPEFEKFRKEFEDFKSKEFSGLKNTISGYEREKHQAEIAKAEAWLDKTYANLGKKYPNAMEEVVTARAAYLREQGNNITEQVIERLFKDVDKMMSEKFNSRAQKRVSGQLDANLRGKDTGAGGGIPGSPAVKPANMKEAKEAALKYFEGRNR